MTKWTVSVVLLWIGGSIIGGLVIALAIFEWYKVIVTAPDSSTACLIVLAGIGLILLLLGLVADVVQKGRPKQ
ncbi:MAG: hypothetical protein OEX09_01995 [Candidatus Bathyarchaeota archaeon]|nr:hypothetical protein [Candidatus Bathyarchaeota archaeon]